MKLGFYSAYSRNDHSWQQWKQIGRFERGQFTARPRDPVAESEQQNPHSASCITTVSLYQETGASFRRITTADNTHSHGISRNWISSFETPGRYLNACERILLTYYVPSAHIINNVSDDVREECVAWWQNMAINRIEGVIRDSADKEFTRICI